MTLPLFVVFSDDPSAHPADVAWLDMDVADLGVIGAESETVVWGIRDADHFPMFDCDDLDLAANCSLYHNRWWSGLQLADGVFPSTSTEGMFAVRHPMQSRAMAAFVTRFPGIDLFAPESSLIASIRAYEAAQAEGSVS